MQFERMPFGRFRGLLISDMEPSHCEWLLTTWKGRKDLGASLRRALEERVKMKAEDCAR